MGKRERERESGAKDKQASERAKGGTIGEENEDHRTSLSPGERQTKKTKTKTTTTKEEGRRTAEGDGGRRGLVVFRCGG